jgi:hypothetical protein
MEQKRNDKYIKKRIKEVSKTKYEEQGRNQE